MSMAMRRNDLENLSDDELRKKHDEIAEHTMVGLNFYQQEILRREQVKGDRRNFRLSVFSLIIAFFAIALTVAQWIWS